MDQDAIDGLNDLFEDVARVQQLAWNPDLVMLGMLANRVNIRRAFDRNALAQLRNELGEAMLDAVLYDRAATQCAKDGNWASSYWMRWRKKYSTNPMCIPCCETNG